MIGILSNKKLGTNNWKKVLDNNLKDHQIKINRVDNNLYFSIHQDLLYKTEIGNFEKNKIFISHDSQRYDEYLTDKNRSSITSVVFSNSVRKI